MNSMNCIFILLVIGIVSIASYQYERSMVHRALQHSRLFVSKHTSRYGPLLNIEPKQESKFDKYKDLLPLDELKKYQREAQSGRELKKTREKNLKIAQKTIPTFDVQLPPKTRKWSQTQIDQAIECLNRHYGSKERSELTSTERVGLINWSSFDKVADEVIENYQSDERLRKKVKSWINFHREKDEIRFDGERWLWKPRPRYKSRIKK